MTREAVGHGHPLMAFESRGHKAMAVLQKDHSDNR